MPGAAGGWPRPGRATTGRATAGLATAADMQMTEQAAAAARARIRRPEPPGDPKSRSQNLGRVVKANIVCLLPWLAERYDVFKLGNLRRPHLCRPRCDCAHFVPVYAPARVSAADMRAGRSEHNTRSTVYRVTGPADFRLADGCWRSFSLPVCSLPELAVAFAAAHPGVTSVITGPQTIGRRLAAAGPGRQRPAAPRKWLATPELAQAPGCPLWVAIAGN